MSLSKSWADMTPTKPTSEGLYIHEVEDRWASALAFTPLVSDLFHDEIKRAAKGLVKDGKGQFMFDYQLSDLTTRWRDDELEETVEVRAPPSSLMLKMAMNNAEPLMTGVVYRKGKPMI